MRDLIQQQSKQSWYDRGCRSTLALSVGVGKTKVAIDILKEKNYKKVLLSTPTVVLHDVNWRTEMQKFEAEDIYNKMDRCCHVSLKKQNLKDYDLIILDESHGITVTNLEYLHTYTGHILSLTATPPKRGERAFKFHTLMPVSFDYNINDAASNELTNDFIVHVVYVGLDSVNKNISAGAKGRKFLTTESANYSYLHEQIETMKDAKYSPYFDQRRYQMLTMARARFLWGLPSKVTYAKHLLNSKVFNKRTLIFANTIAQAEELETNTFHSKVKDHYLNAFINQEVDRLSCVNALNEGITIPNVNTALMLTPSNEKRSVQRIGRSIRPTEDGISHFYILVARGTVEEDWINSSLENIDEERIQKHFITDFLN